MYIYIYTFIIYIYTYIYIYIHIYNIYIYPYLNYVQTIQNWGCADLLMFNSDFKLSKIRNRME